MPEPLFSLVLFAASVGPGYVFLRIAERWEPRRDRTALHEAAELVVIGAVTSAVAALIVLLVGEAIGGIDADRLVADQFAYVVKEPGTSLIFLLAFLILSYGSAALLAYRLYMPFDVRSEDRKLFHPNDTLWNVAFSRELPKRHAAWVRVATRDGRIIAGFLQAFSGDDSDPKGLVLVPPHGGSIKVTYLATGKKLELDSDCLVLDGADIGDVFVNYVPLDTSSSADGGQ
jgi:hypothetical protein